MARDDVADVVGGGRGRRDQVAQGRSGATGGVVGGDPRRLGVGMVGEIVEHRPEQSVHGLFVGGEQSAQPARPGVHGGASEVVQSHPHPGEPLHGVGPRHEGEGVGCHHGDIGQTQ